MATVATPVRLLTTREVAHLLRVSERSIYRLVDSGRLRPFRMSAYGRLRFRVDDVEDLIAGREPAEAGVDVVEGRDTPAAPRSLEAGAASAAGTREAPCR